MILPYQVLFKWGQASHCTQNVFLILLFLQQKHFFLRFMMRTVIMTILGLRLVERKNGKQVRCWRGCSYQSWYHGKDKINCLSLYDMLILMIRLLWWKDKTNIIIIAQVVNNTKYELTLNPDEKCGRECDCFGWQVCFLWGLWYNDNDDMMV